MGRQRVGVAAVALRAFGAMGVAAVVLGLGLVSWTWSVLPPRPVIVPPDASAPLGNSQVVRGAFHVHTTRSDGRSAPAQVARSAARARLQFVVLTDHGDGTRSPDPPRYVDGVLVIDAVEISTNSGHYLALGLARSPYPLGGNAAGVVEDVRRFGGVGIVAHPASPSTELAWQDWDLAAGVDGIEWLNADSAWRDESIVKLLSSVGTYFFRPSATVRSLLDRPTATLSQWDKLTRHRQVVGVAGTDAHTFIDDESLFRTFSLNILLAAAWSGEAIADAEVLIESIRRGRVFTTVDAVASPATLLFEAVAAGRTFQMGERLPSDLSNEVELRATIPAVEGGRLVLIADGLPIASVDGPELRYQPAPGKTAAYRVEAFHAAATSERSGWEKNDLPWIVSNPIYLGDSRERTAAGGRRRPPSAVDSETLAAGKSSPFSRFSRAGGGQRLMSTWAVERDPETTATASDEEGTVFFAYTLAADLASRSPFAAISHSVRVGALDGFQALTFSVSADRSVRISCQLRDGARPGEPRWRTSFWADTAVRQVTISLSEMRPVGPGQTTAPDLSRIDSVLFVADLVNSSHADTATVRVADVQLERW